MQEPRLGWGPQVPPCLVALSLPFQTPPQIAVGSVMLFLVTGSCTESRGWDTLLTAAPCRFVECDHVPLHPQVPLGPALCHPPRAHLPHRGQHEEGPRVQPRGQHLAEGSRMQGWVQSPSWGGGQLFPPHQHPTSICPHPLPHRCCQHHPLPRTHSSLGPINSCRAKDAPILPSLLPCHSSTRSTAFADFEQRSHCRSPQDPAFSSTTLLRGMHGSCLCSLEKSCLSPLTSRPPAPHSTPKFAPGRAQHRDAAESKTWPQGPPDLTKRTRQGDALGGLMSSAVGARGPWGGGPCASHPAHRAGAAPAHTP